MGRAESIWRSDCGFCSYFLQRAGAAKPQPGKPIRHEADFAQHPDRHQNVLVIFAGKAWEAGLMQMVCNRSVAVNRMPRGVSGRASTDQAYRSAILGGPQDEVPIIRHQDIRV